MAVTLRLQHLLELHECSGYHRGLYDDTYVGAILVRTPDGKDILTFLYKYEDDGKKYIEIHPITNPYEYLKSGNNCCKCQWGYKYPKRAVKIFDTFAEYKADKKAKENKSEENLCATEKKKKVVQANAILISFLLIFNPHFFPISQIHLSLTIISWKVEFVSFVNPQIILLLLQHLPR